MEKMVDRFVKFGLIQRPFHHYQHAYRAGGSTAFADLHFLVSEIEEGLFSGDVRQTFLEFLIIISSMQLKSRNVPWS